MHRVRLWAARDATNEVARRVLGVHRVHRVLRCVTDWRGLLLFIFVFDFLFAASVSPRYLSLTCAPAFRCSAVFSRALACLSRAGSVPFPPARPQTTRVARTRGVPCSLFAHSARKDTHTHTHVFQPCVCVLACIPVRVLYSLCSDLRVRERQRDG